VCWRQRDACLDAFAELGAGCWEAGSLAAAWPTKLSESPQFLFSLDLCGVGWPCSFVPLWDMQHQRNLFDENIQLVGWWLGRCTKAGWRLCWQQRLGGA
jgi:hypothetical protein